MSAAISLTGCDRFMAGPPDIQPELMTIDMGTHYADDMAERIIEIRNTGESRLEIERIVSHCGCTQGQMLEASIPPGKTGRLRITVNGMTAPSKSPRTRITIFSNDPDEPNIDVSIETQFRPGAYWEPERIDFGDVVQGETPELKVRVYPEQLTPMGLESAKWLAPEYLEVTAETVPDSYDDQWEQSAVDVTVRVSADASIGFHKANVGALAPLRFIRMLSIPVEVEIVTPDSPEEAPVDAPEAD